MSQAPATESAKARHAYTVYESMGPQRSTAKVGQALGKSKDLIDRWSAAHSWRERVAQYDARLASEEAAAEAEERRRARKQRIQVARVARTKGVEAFPHVKPERLAENTDRLVRLLEYADATERKDLGEPDQQVEVSGPDGRAIHFTITLDRAGGAERD